MDRLARPTAALCHNFTPIPPETSLRRAAEIMGEEGQPALAVADAGILYGAITEAGLLKAAAAGIDPSAEVIDWVDGQAPSISSRDTAAEAFRQMETRGLEWMLVIDPAGHPIGIISPSRLTVDPQRRSHPRMVGGMATPLGVYLTNGIVGAGVSGWALVLTGFTLFGFFYIGRVLMNGLELALPVAIKSRPWFGLSQEVGAMLVFLAGLRFAPLAGIHAAEHKVVHAIERGEELIPSIVKRMPRVHPRCGTNLAVGAMIFLGIMGWEQIRELELRLLLAMIVTLSIWQPLGNFMQRYVTTREPNDKQIAMGIKSGKELLEKSLYLPQNPPHFLVRLLRSGIFQVMLGAMLAEAFIYLVLTLFAPDGKGILPFLFS